jgi:hypothetical protein
MIEGAVFGLNPIPALLLPLIGEADGQHAQKHHHRPEPREAEFAECHSPRKQEGDFQIEDDEENGDQIKPDVEFHARIVESIEAALIGGQLFRIGLLIGDDERCNQQCKTDHGRNTDKHHKWQIVLQNSAHRRPLCCRLCSGDSRNIGMVRRDSAAQHVGQDKLFLLLRFFPVLA